MKKIIFLLALTGCATNPIQVVVPTNSPYAAQNQTGIIKFAAGGHRGDQNRVEAMKYMHSDCKGKYEITREYTEKDNPVMYPVGGVYMDISGQWRYVEYRCIN